jgi:hypothetical protein
MTEKPIDAKSKYIKHQKNDYQSWQSSKSSSSNGKDDNIMSRIISVCPQGFIVKKISTSSFSAEFALDEQKRIFLRQFTQLGQLDDSKPGRRRNGWDIKWSSNRFIVEEENYYIDDKLYFRKRHRIDNNNRLDDGVIESFMLRDQENGDILYKYDRITDLYENRVYCYFEDSDENYYSSGKIYSLSAGDYDDGYNYHGDVGAYVRKIIFVNGGNGKCISHMPKEWKHITSKFPQDWRPQSSSSSSSENMFDDLITLMSAFPKAAS